MPSIKTRAAWLAPKVLIPRIQNSEKSLPGSPVRETEMIPGTLPPNIFDTEVAGTCKSSISTLVIAPTTETLRWLPLPVTTTSSNKLTSGSIPMVSLS